MNNEDLDIESIIKLTNLPNIEKIDYIIKAIKQDDRNESTS